MGCDIHLHVEIKVNGKWLHYNHPRIDRDYHLFARMAGVRNCDEYDIEPISRPRGLPEDMTETTAFDYDENWGNDAHSTSWLSGKECADLEKWWEGRHDRNLSLHGFNAEFGYLFGSGFGILGTSDCVKGVEDVRFVFWFDN